jgi:HK97 family phage portal protein
MDYRIKALLRAQAEGKALGPHPAFMDPGRPLGVTDLNLGRIAGRSPSDGGGKGQRLAQKGAERYLSAFGGANAMDWIMDCTRYMADTVASAEYHFEKPSDPNVEKKPGDSTQPPERLKKLFEKPNPYMDYIEMMELLVIDLLLVGNAYWLKWRTNAAGQPLAIYRLAPPYIEIATEPWGPGAYIYQVPNHDKLAFNSDEVIHLKLANPEAENPYYGLGLLQGAGRAADLELALTDSQSSYYENHAMPSVAVESERRVPRDVFHKMRAQLRARAQGPRNAGELLVLEAGLKLNSFAPHAGDAGFGELSQMSRDRVFSWFRINPKLLGIAEAGTESVSEAQKQFDDKTARPFMNKLQKKISAELTRDAWNLDFCIDYEYQLNPEERAKLAGMVGQLPGITIDESREAGGLGPHPDKTIGSMTINLPGENGGGGGPGETPSRNGFPDPGLPGEAGRPPKRENTKAFPRAGRALPSGAAVRKGKETKKALNSAEVLADSLKRLENVKMPEDELISRRTTDVDAAAAAFKDDLAKAARVLERGLLDTIDGKAFQPSKIVEKLRYSKAWKAFDELAEEAYENALLKVMSAASIHHAEIGLKPAGEIDYEALVDQLLANKEGGISAITGTLKDWVSAHVKEARKDDPARSNLQAELQAAITDWIANKADMISITEATRGYNEATLAVAEQSGASHVLVSDGTDDDAPCIEANGEIWPLSEAKERILEHPRCRRAFVPIIPKA